MKNKNEHTCDELLQELLDSCQELDFTCRANIPLPKKGFGIDEEKKNTACENVIKIVKQIKKIKGV